MTGVTCVREDGTGDQLMLSNKVTKGHLGQRRAEESSWDRTDPATTVTLDPARTVTLDPSGTLAPGSAAGSVLVKTHHHKRSIKHRYQLLETLGRGTYGKVKKAVDKSTGTLVAVKSIQKEKITDELDRVHLRREIEITALLKHEHIIRVCEVFESSEKIIIVMEYASNGELYDFINNKQQIPESQARRFFRQIVSAVHYCHKNGIVHRDIKLENILLDENLNVKLADFGLSNTYHNKQVLETYCGSPLYASPEIVKGFPYHGPEVDCWALGVLLYALIYGSMPFDNCNYKTLAEQIGSGQYRQPPHLSGADGLIDWMLTVNPARRATIEDIANHWWVNWGYDVTVCDCPLLSECQSPLLARYIECQNTLGYKGTKAELSRVLPREDEGCLRKSKKENDINQSQQEVDVSAARKKPKGILKKRCSFDSSFLNSENCMELSQEAAAAYKSHISTDAKCTFNKPKKGILKKTCERESGYSSSPERISECQKTAEGRSERYTRRKKGILKNNGRFSSSLDLPEDCLSLRLSDSMEDLVYPNAEAAGSPSRPSSVISDDSFLSSDSFDLLDLSSETKSKLLCNSSFYSSEEEETSWSKLQGTLYNPNHKL